MGFSLSWLAIKGKSPEVILNALALEKTGKREAIPESPIVSTLLPTGWFLIVANRAEHRLISEKIITPLSNDCEIITSDTEDHVMVSRIFGWENGKITWSVVHDGSEGDCEHLKITGTPPEILHEVKIRMEFEQKKSKEQSIEVDYFSDIPVELGKALIGYRHDEDLYGEDGYPFEVLQSIANDKPLWCKFLGL